MDGLDGRKSQFGSFAGVPSEDPLVLWYFSVLISPRVRRMPNDPQISLF